MQLHTHGINFHPLAAPQNLPSGTGAERLLEGDQVNTPGPVGKSGLIDKVSRGGVEAATLSDYIGRGLEDTY